MAEVGFREPYRTHGFVIEIQGTQCPVTKVTGLSEGAADTIDYPDGGSSIVHKVASGVVKFDPLVIERVVDGGPNDRFFKDWFNEMFKLNAAKNGSSSVRRNGAVIKVENGRGQFNALWGDPWVLRSSGPEMVCG